MAEELTKDQLQEENLALEDEIEEEEWESDWGAVFWCIVCLIVVLGLLGIACWQPWVV